MPYITRTIRSIDLENNEFISDRTINSNIRGVSFDINQSNGFFAVAQPYNLDGTVGGSVTVYPQSLALPNSTLIEYRTFYRVGSLYFPTDAKFDYLHNKLWIADTGNNRVLKVNLNTNQADLAIDTGMEYPHALAVELNTGNIFIKAYESYARNHKAIFYYQKDGTLLSTFSFNNDDDESSSTSSESSSSQSQSFSESSSSAIVFPFLPSSRTIAYDHVRSRAWWTDNIRIYMADIRNKQIQTYDVRQYNNTLMEVLNISVEFSTGNALVVVRNLHNDRFIVQANRDNNKILGMAYIEN